MNETMNQIRATSLRILVALPFTLPVACTGAGSLEPEAQCSVLPDRSVPIDTSRITADFSEQGGEAFVKLTGPPTPIVVDELQRAGLTEPEGRSEPVVFEFIWTVWGRIPPNGVNKIAALLCVTRIEPATDSVGIFPHRTDGW